MVEVKVFLFAIGTLFNIEKQQLFEALHTEVTIDLASNIITINQQDLQTFGKLQNDARKNLKQLLNTEQVDSTFNNIYLISKEFYEKNGNLNASLKLGFKSIKDLEQLSFFVDEENMLYLFNFEDFGISSTQAQIEGNYLKFNTDKPIEIRFEITKSAEHTGLLPLWEEIATKD